MCRGHSSDVEFDPVTRFAQEVIINEQARELSHSVRLSREKCREVYYETGAMVLAILLLGRDKSVDSTTALINLFGVDLDGEASETFSCSILDRGNEILKRLKDMKPSEVENNCIELFNEAKKRDLLEVNDVGVHDVCRSTVEIDKHRNTYVKAIESKIYCDE